MDRIHENQVTRQFLDAVCSVPNEGEAVLLESSWVRLCHGDLEQMTDAERGRELARVEMRLTLEENPDDWILGWLEKRRRLLRQTVVPEISEHRKQTRRLNIVEA